VGDLALLSAWLDWLEARALSPRTVQQYGYGVWRLVCFTRPASFAELTEEDVTRFLASVKDQASAKVFYSRGIKSFSHWAYRRGHVPEDFAAYVTVKKPPRKRKVALEWPELERYLAAAARRDPRRAWTFALKYAIGARTAELAGIRPAEDLTDDSVRLFGKGAKERWVELNELASMAIGGLLPASNGTLVGVKGQQITNWGTEAAKDAGLYPKLRYRTTHVLRASFITHLLRDGADVGVVAELVGHSSIAITNDYIADASPEVRQRAVALIDRRAPVERVAVAV
jgi:integrase/recombinase XerD